MTLLDGKKVAAAMREKLKNKVGQAKEEGKTVRLSVVIVGKDPASEIYVRNKAKACEEAGIESDTVRLDETCTQEELETVVSRLAKDETVNGILLQLPLPAGLDEKKVLALVPPEKDVDGFSAENVGRLFLFRRDGNEACTPSGILALLDYYGIPIAGKHAVVVGRSNIVGKPMAMLLLSRDATVTVCHSKTENLAKYTKDADILIVAVGKAGLIREDMVKEGVVVVDAGMNRENGKLCGDVDYEGVSRKASYITPVPGGVGPMTITMLLYNTVKAALGE
ncbi:MAG: bifunctional methylenetetrahydrofolate dehydrogenase/methenyltetrahydrofolate cyclohydrolase FolD [Candidatus Borkfalkiaceae bacterium]|nr:bifunctional methylenetetrahydrofolate dehydrogenase/methenyltetrahydrofolate cyclohydrolase FolD [Christensenellaceae bacterium]